MCIKANMPLPIHNRSPVSHSQRLATIPTQRSVIARLRYSSLDGGCVEVSLCRATRISVFPRNAAMDRKMLKAERKVSWPCNPPVTVSEQNSSSTTIWFSFSVTFVTSMASLFAATICSSARCINFRFPFI